MPATWFTSDTHFGHANIIKLAGRPFASVEDMDETLIANWNAIVSPEDEIWHLGDFSFRSARAASDLLKRLNGRKHLIAGNHDSHQARTAPGWVSSQPYAELSLGANRFVLSHYAFRVWNRSERGAMHLYGHSHGSLAGDSLSWPEVTKRPNFPHKQTNRER